MSKETYNILISGASSPIGMGLIRLLEGQGHSIVGLARNKEKLKEFKDITLESLDFSKLFKQKFCVDIFIHIAAETPGAELDLSPEKIARYQAVNIDGTKHLLNAINKEQIKQIIYISSHTVEDLKGKNGEIKDSYAHSKAVAEKIIEQYDCPWTILRPTGVISETFWKPFLKGLSNQSEIVLKGTQSALRQYVYVGDVSQAIFNSIANSATYKEKYFIGSKKAFSEMEMYQTIKRITGYQFKIKTESQFMVLLKALIKDLLTFKLGSPYSSSKRNRFAFRNFDVDIKNTSDLNYQPLDLEQTIQKIL